MNSEDFKINDLQINKENIDFNGNFKSDATILKRHFKNTAQTIDDRYDIGSNSYSCSMFNKETELSHDEQPTCDFEEFDQKCQLNITKEQNSHRSNKDAIATALLGFSNLIESNREDSMNPELLEALMYFKKSLMNPNQPFKYNNECESKSSFKPLSNLKTL